MILKSQSQSQSQSQMIFESQISQMLTAKVTL